MLMLIIYHFYLLAFISSAQNIQDCHFSCLTNECIRPQNEYECTKCDSDRKLLKLGHVDKGQIYQAIEFQKSMAIGMCICDGNGTGVCEMKDDFEDFFSQNFKLIYFLFIFWGIFNMIIKVSVFELYEILDLYQLIFLLYYQKPYLTSIQFDNIIKIRLYIFPGEYFLSWVKQFKSSLFDFNTLTFDKDWMNQFPKLPIFETDLSISSRYLYLLIIVSSLYGLKLLFFFLDLSYQKELEGKTFSQLEEIQNKRRQDLESRFCFRYRTSAAWMEKGYLLLQVLPEIFTYLLTNEALFWSFITFQVKDIQTSGITSFDYMIAIIITALLILHQAFLMLKIEKLENKNEYYISHQEIRTERNIIFRNYQIQIFLRKIFTISSIIFLNKQPIKAQIMLTVVYSVLYLSFLITRPFIRIEQNLMYLLNRSIEIIIIYQYLNIALIYEKGGDIIEPLKILSNSSIMLVLLFGIGWILFFIKQIRDFYQWQTDPLNIHTDTNTVQPDTAITDYSQNINPISKRRALRPVHKVIPDESSVDRYDQINSNNISGPKPRRNFKFREIQKK